MDASLPRRVVLVLPLLAAACAQDAPPRRTSFPPLRYEYLAKLRLNVADIDVDEALPAAPGTLVAEKQSAGVVQFSRPLCEYPKYPRYTGPANNAEAAKLASNYTCS